MDCRAPGVTASRQRPCAARAGKLEGILPATYTANIVDDDGRRRQLFETSYAIIETSYGIIKPSLTPNPGASSFFAASTRVDYVTGRRWLVTWIMSNCTAHNDRLGDVVVRRRPLPRKGPMAVWLDSDYLEFLRTDCAPTASSTSPSRTPAAWTTSPRHCSFNTLLVSCNYYHTT